MAGVTRAEAFFSFNSGDVQYGIEADRRSRILKAYVRNTYTFHLNEIFATIVNEYTDWERPVQHPINIRWVIAFVVRPYGPMAHGCDCYGPPPPAPPPNAVGSCAEPWASAAADACNSQQAVGGGAVRLRQINISFLIKCELLLYVCVCVYTQYLPLYTRLLAGKTEEFSIKAA